jgi:16S rRNA processing protein RimM
MSGPELDSSEPLIAVAKTVRTRGLRGELVADLLTDFPERFDGLEQVIAVGPNGERLPLELENHWFQEKRIILKFAGYDSIDQAKQLIGFEVTVPEVDCVELEEDEFFDWELEGCLVKTMDGTEVGRVQEVMRTGGVALLVIKGADEREVLVPLAEDICVEIDIAAQQIRIDPPEGLLEM